MNPGFTSEPPTSQELLPVALSAIQVEYQVPVLGQPRVTQAHAQGCLTDRARAAASTLTTTLHKPPPTICHRRGPSESGACTVYQPILPHPAEMGKRRHQSLFRRMPRHSPHAHTGSLRRTRSNSSNDNFS